MNVNKNNVFIVLLHHLIDSMQSLK